METARNKANTPLPPEPTIAVTTAVNTFHKTKPSNINRQTREHADLDIAVHRKDNAGLRRLLEGSGYREEPRFDSSECMYVMKNEAGQRVDIHVFEYDENGNNVYGIEYPFGSLTGTGLIDGQEVNCIDPKFQFQFKTGYAPREIDRHDVHALSEKFGFELSGIERWPEYAPPGID